MKQTLKMLFLTGVFTASIGVFAQGPKLTLKLGKIPLREALAALQEKTHYQFTYNAAEINAQQTVDMNVKEMDVKQILNHCLPAAGLYYTLEGNLFTIRRKQMQEIERTQTFQGIVKDKDGVPLPGVTVLLKGTKYGTITDTDGKFQIGVPEGKRHTLAFSFIGMKTKDVVCHAGKNEITLEENSTLLSEVTVTTGYQTINRTRMTGAVETVTAKEIANKGYSSVGDVLRGTLAGVSTRNTSGKPGAQPEIRIRGLNSLYGSMDPIWIVDGVPFKGNINDLMPEDIESITVLKDAAASAIYGSQAANGVIVVKRKAGREGNPTLHITSNFSLESAPHTKLELMNSAEKIAFERSVYEDFPNQADGGRIIRLLRDADRGKITKVAAEAEIERLSRINTDWYDEIFRKPFSHAHNLSFSGGTERTQYYASLNIQQQQGVVPTNTNSNWGAMLRLSHDFNQRLTFHFNLNSTIRKDKDTYSGINALSYATFANPYERPYDENGHMEYDRSYASAQSSLKDGYKDDVNFFNELYNNHMTTSSFNTLASLDIEVKLFDNLKYTTTGSIYRNTGNTEYVLGPGTWTAKYKAWIKSLYSELPDNLNNGSLRQANSKSDGYTWQNRIEYMNTFKENHFVSLFLGHEMSEFNSNSNYILFPEYDPVKGLISVPELDANQIKYVQQLITNMESYSESRSRSVSFFAAANYSYKDRYVVSGSIRMDGADIIGTSNRFSPLWNASLKYNLQNESFMQDIDWLNELSFRFSYGYTGSIDKDALPFNVLTYAMGIKFLGYDLPSNIRPKNPSIKWQKKQDRSIGMDVAFLHNRIRATFNYYNNVTRDLLDQKTLPISVGINTIRYNSSSIRNYGYELNLRTVNVRYKDFSWITELNLSANRNQILESFYKSVEDVPAGYERTEPVEGTSANSWIGYRFGGIDPRTGHTLALVDNSNRKMPIGFQREDGTWVLDMDDEQNEKDKKRIKETLGNSYPPISGGFGSTFTWKQWVLTSRFAFMFGHKISSAYFSVAGTGSIAAAGQNVLKQEATRWRKAGDITDMPGYNISGMASSLQSDWYDRKLERGDFIKCSEISLGYFFPNTICKALLLSSLRLNLNIRDIFTLSKYKGADPENFGGFGYPNSRKYMLSLSVGF